MSIEEVHEKYHAMLKKLPNSLNTFISTKKVAGQDTMIQSITVFVSEKVDEARLRAEDMIPKMIGGYPTDVIELKPATWKAGKTAVSQLSPSQQQRLLGLSHRTVPVKQRKKSALKASPYEIDWTSKCTPVRDQQNCGSCCGMGSIDTMQDNFTILENIIVALSVQQAFFCAQGSCEGGDMVENVLNFLVSNGVALESDCPYVSGNGIDEPCGYGLASDWYLRGKKLKSWAYLNDPASMKEALSTAPVVTTFDVPASFMSYVSGIYQPLPNEEILGGHCVSVVGCSDSQSYWKCKNSWGTSVEMAGYFEMLYGVCQIDVTMYALTVDGPIPTPTPNPVPPIPSPCTIGKGTVRAMNFLPWLLHRKGRFYYLDREGNKSG